MLFTASTNEPRICTQADQRHSPSLPIVHGKIQQRHVAEDPDLKYCLFIPKILTPGAPLFVAVHGIRRGVHNQIRQFAPLIDRLGGIMVAPLFQKKRFSDYQRLGRPGKGERADLALKRMLKDVSTIMDLPFPQLVMFGYSGGGQFVHRYAMANPRQVKRMAIAAPGWYTFPDMNQPYPRGIRRSSVLPDITFDPARFLKIPTMVIVGENDVLQDAALNQDKKIGSQQGANRMERGQRWVSAMSASASRFQLDTPFNFELLTGCGHSFSECMRTGKMGHMVVNFLFDDPSTKRPSPLTPIENEIDHPHDRTLSDERLI